MSDEKDLQTIALGETHPLFEKFREALMDVKEQIHNVAAAIVGTEDGKTAIAQKFHGELEQFNGDMAEYAIYLRAHLEAATQIITNAIVLQRESLH